MHSLVALFLMFLLPTVLVVQRRREFGMSDGVGDPSLEQFDDKEWQIQEDPPELVEARKKLEKYLAAEDNDGVCCRSCGAIFSSSQRVNGIIKSSTRVVCDCLPSSATGLLAFSILLDLHCVSANAH
jgi:hypothetical protein